MDEIAPCKTGTKSNINQKLSSDQPPTLCRFNLTKEIENEIPSNSYN